MGATVTTGKKAGALRAPDGRILYALFEQTYEKNCYPHTPTWSCHSFGPIEEAIERVFLCASSCEGGMLQNRNGSITPEGYIAGWLAELAAPVAMGDCRIALAVGKGFYDAFREDRLDRARQVLAGAGFAQMAETLAPGETLELRLHAHALAIEALCVSGTVLPWRVFTDMRGLSGADGDAALGYAPPPAKSYAVDRPEAIKADRENRLVRGPDGAWRCVGWEYRAVGGFIRDLWRAELAEPGSCRKRIKAYRAALEAAPALPAGARVVVDLGVPMKRWERELAEHLAAKHAARPTRSGFEIEVGEDRMYDLTSLPSHCTTWLIPGQADQLAA